MGKVQQSISLSRKPNPHCFSQRTVSPGISPPSTWNLSVFQHLWGNGVSRLLLLLSCQLQNHSGVHFLRVLTSSPRHRYSSVCLRAWGHLIHILQARQLIACLPQKPTFTWKKQIASGLETPDWLETGIFSVFILTSVQTLLVEHRCVHYFEEFVCRDRPIQCWYRQLLDYIGLHRISLICTLG